MQMEKIFAYGTLLNADIQQQLFGRKLAAGLPAVLNNFRKYTHEKYPYIVPSEGWSVEGRILSVTAAELEIADRWEEVPEVYQRKRVRVDIKKNKFAHTWVYVKS